MVGRRTQTMDQAKRAVGTRPSRLSKTQKARKAKNEATRRVNAGKSVDTGMLKKRKTGNRSTYGITNKSGGKVPTKLEAQIGKAQKSAKSLLGRSKFRAGQAKRAVKKAWRNR